MRPRIPVRLRPVLLAAFAAALIALAPCPARATARDYVGETLVSGAFETGDLGMELGSDSRFDRDYRLQGWFTPELEWAPVKWWLVESKSAFVNRGRGLEFGGWVAESRVRLLDRARWPLDVSAAGEYEVETPPAKHLTTERMLNLQLVATRELIDGLSGTANVGRGHRLTPFPRIAMIYAFGLRYPERHALMAGVELTSNPLEREKRIIPQVWIALPRGWMLRLGGAVGVNARPYRFIGRSVLEVEF